MLPLSRAHLYRLKRKQTTFIHSKLIPTLFYIKTTHLHIQHTYSQHVFIEEISSFLASIIYNFESLLLECEEIGEGAGARGRVKHPPYTNS